MTVEISEQQNEKDDKHNYRYRRFLAQVQFFFKWFWLFVDSFLSDRSSGIRNFCKMHSWINSSSDFLISDDNILIKSRLQWQWIFM